MNPFKYSNTNKRYHTLDYYYKQKYHSKVCKVGLDAGFTCPNIDGTKGYGGCIYCLAGSRNNLSNKKTLKEQFDEIKNILEKKWPNSKFIAYFQANSNTYDKTSVLQEKYEEVLNYDNVIGLNIATRADAISDDALSYLEKLNKKTDLTIELGLQTIHDKTAKLINRCHSLKEFEDMVKKLKEINIKVVVHIINGLPYETKEMMIDTVKYLNNLPIDGIKIHMLFIEKGSALATLYEKEKFHVLTKEEYVDIVCEQLTYLKPEIVIHRLTGDGNKDTLIAPLWTLKKVCVLNDIDKTLKEKDLYQGLNLL